MKLKFLGFAHCDYYGTGNGAPWSVGDVREVSKEDADRLVGAFPEAFELVKPARKKKTTKMEG